MLSLGLINTREGHLPVRRVHRPAEVNINTIWIHLVLMANGHTISISALEIPLKRFICQNKKIVIIFVYFGLYNVRLKTI